MPSNVSLLLALLGGYLFIHFFHRTYFRAQALDGHRLVFEAAIAGFSLFVPCRLLVLLLVGLDTAHHLQNTWYRIAGFEPLLSTLTLTVLAAPCFAMLLNLLSGTWALFRESKESDRPINLKRIWSYSRGEALGKAVASGGNALQNLLYRAALEAESLRTVCITLSSRKVYVGWVAKSPNLRANDSYVSLIPVMSGYRDKDSLDLFFTVSYPTDQYFNPESGVAREDFTVHVPLSQIVDARFFDFASYEPLFLREDAATPE